MFPRVRTAISSRMRRTVRPFPRPTNSTRASACPKFGSNAIGSDTAAGFELAGTLSPGENRSGTAHPDALRADRVSAGSPRRVSILPGSFAAPCCVPLRLARSKHALPASARRHTTNCFLLIRPSSGDEHFVSSPGWAAHVLPSRLLLVVGNPDHPLITGTRRISRRRSRKSICVTTATPYYPLAHAKYSSPSATPSTPSGGSTSTGSPPLHNATLRSNSLRPLRSKSSRARLTSKIAP